MNQKREKYNIITLIQLHVLIFFYSLSSLFSKVASQNIFLSSKFICFYGISVVILAVYALLWQQVLKKINLSTALSNKSITVVWGMVWGVFIFKEKISLNMVLGIVLVLIGIILVTKYDE